MDAIDSGFKSSWMRAYPFLAQFFPEDMKAVPFQVKKIACKDAYTSFFANVKKVKEFGGSFDLKYRSRKSPVQSCFIPSSALSEVGAYYTISGKLKMSEKIPDKVKDSRLVLDHGRWFLSCPYVKSTVRVDSQERIVALDPGLRTFLTGFSESSVFKFGEGAATRIYRLCLSADALISKIAKSNSRRKRNMQKALDRMKRKIKDLVTELHFKCAHWLCERYDIILLPTFEVSDMVTKIKRKIRSKTVRSMLGLSHFAFEQRLKSTAEIYGRTVVDVNEAYTSKTASWTGEVKQIGGSKKITSQGITLDRDENGARGIFLRALADTPWLRDYAACTVATSCNRKVSDNVLCN